MTIRIEDLVSQTEAAEMRGVSVQAISHLIKAGRFQTVQVSGKTFLLREEVATYKPGRGGRPRKERDDEEPEQPEKPSPPSRRPRKTKT